MNMRADINGAELCVDTIGDRGDPAVLLIMGAAGSMDRWEEPFCGRLAAAGRLVIRYDHRDTGGSTTYPPGRPGYTGDDLVADALGILDHLGIERAHLVGISMGGGIVQRIAVDHPERVLSLTLMSTTPVGSGGPDLPPMSAELREIFGGEEQPAEPDWSDREAAIAFMLDGERPYAGSRGVDEAAMRDLLGRVYDRSTSLPSADNHFALESSEMARSRLAEIASPALVIHGADDPLFRPAHGEALASEIAGAKLLMIDRLGHELPPWAWDDVLPALIAVTGRGRRELVRACYRAYESGDRSSLEPLLSDDFTFSAPPDVGIDRATYFERCWPSSETTASFAFKRLLEADDEVFVTYEATKTDGRRFRNTEIFGFRGEQISRVEVYFGWDVE